MVGIICFWDRYATPYLLKYEKLLIDNGIQYEIIYWHRNSVNKFPKVEKDGNTINIKLLCKLGYLKIFSFLKWRITTKKIIKKNKYTHLIVLSTVPGVLLIEFLLNQYKEKYIFDIRDYTYEKNKLFKKLVMMLVNGSSLTAISSLGFMRWLDESQKIKINHNITIDSTSINTPPDLKNCKVIRFGFVGNVRLDSQTRDLIFNLANDFRFEQHFYGRVLPTCDIESLKEKHNIQNLYIHGPFGNEEKEIIYSKIELINTVYANPNKNNELTFADSTPLPNRLYDALIFYRPLIASNGTYLAELIDKYYLGLNLKGIELNSSEKIASFAQVFDKELFKKGCDSLREIVIMEEQSFISSINIVLNSWKTL